MSSKAFVYDQSLDRTDSRPGEKYEPSTFSWPSQIIHLMREMVLYPPRPAPIHSRSQYLQLYHVYLAQRMPDIVKLLPEPFIKHYPPHFPLIIYDRFLSDVRTPHPTYENATLTYNETVAHGIACYVTHQQSVPHRSAARTDAGGKSKNKLKEDTLKAMRATGLPRQKFYTNKLSNVYASFEQHLRLELGWSGEEIEDWLTHYWWALNFVERA